MGFDHPLDKRLQGTGSQPGTRSAHQRFLLDDLRDYSLNHFILGKAAKGQCSISRTVEPRHSSVLRLCHAQDRTLCSYFQVASHGVAFICNVSCSSWALLGL